MGWTLKELEEMDDKHPQSFHNLYYLALKRREEIREAGELDDEVKIDPTSEDYAWVDSLLVDPEELQTPSLMSIKVENHSNNVVDDASSSKISDNIPEEKSPIPRKTEKIPNFNEKTSCSTERLKRYA
ncbi:hypothetical protein ZOSMA_11G00670 [Zostera marina]|uniref:Uncharacterized protein n=1 Tax=Zostera marina TaxID=29655 RepID=A0A0K9Q1K8_ZOSMR|nr:hypothetical protein ZOSMA_11G00670 [Zostera marina]